MNFIKTFRVDSRVRLHQHDPAGSLHINKEAAERIVDKNHDRLFKLQTRLFAENKRAILIVLQGMDASGKDGAIRHVMRGLNPQGCAVTSFKAPSEEERDHDFLWRIHKAVPAKGEIGIFNRSHYEDVLVVRVQKLVPKHVWKERYDQINAFERILADSGTTVLKFFLHVSKDEQKERLAKRLTDPQVNWKFNENDLVQRKKWDDYREAYEAALNRCSSKAAPWFVIPSDKKWFRNVAISEILRETLEKMDPQLPKPIADIGKIRIV